MTEKKIRSKAKEDAREGSTEAAEPMFSKEQLLASGRFRGRRDMAEALLEEGQSYTVRDVEEKIKEYQKGKVR